MSNPGDLGMGPVYKYTREELLAIGRKDLGELVDFAIGLQEHLRVLFEDNRKRIEAIEAQMKRLG